MGLHVCVTDPADAVDVGEAVSGCGPDCEKPKAIGLNVCLVSGGACVEGNYYWAAKLDEVMEGPLGLVAIPGGRLSTTQVEGFVQVALEPLAVGKVPHTVGGHDSKLGPQRRVVRISLLVHEELKSDYVILRVSWVAVCYPANLDCPYGHFHPYPLACSSSRYKSVDKPLAPGSVAGHVHDEVRILPLSLGELADVPPVV